MARLWRVRIRPCKCTVVHRLADFPLHRCSPVQPGKYSHAENGSSILLPALTSFPGKLLVLRAFSLATVSVAAPRWHVHGTRRATTLQQHFEGGRSTLLPARSGTRGSSSSRRRFRCEGEIGSLASIWRPVIPAPSSTGGHAW
jgi:hypothetical protein